MRAVIYARYSSDIQSPASIEDQVRLCRERIQQENGTVVEIYADYAISGGSLRNRPQCARSWRRQKVPGLTMS
jgi:site-specific DNA recombinase